MLHAVHYLINFALNTFILLLLFSAAMSLLISFQVLNPANPTIFAIDDFLDRVTSPALAPFRARIGPIAGVDFTPVILILLLTILQAFIARLFGAAG